MAAEPALTLAHEFALAHEGPINVARFNTFGRYVLTGGADRSIKLWNAQTGPAYAEEQGPSSSQPAPLPIKEYKSHSQPVSCLAISPTSAHFASSAANDVGRLASGHGTGDTSLLIWDVSTAQVVRRFNAHVGRLEDVVFAAPQPSSQEATTGGEAQLLVAAGYDCKARIYDLRAKGAWKPIMTLSEATDSIQSIQVVQSPGCAILTGSVDGQVRTYDLRMGQLRTDVIDAPVTSLSLSSDGASVLITTLDSTHRLLDLSDGTLLQKFESRSKDGYKNDSYRSRSALLSVPPPSGASAALSSMPRLRLSKGLDSTVFAGDELGCLWAWDVLSGSVRSRTRPPDEGAARPKQRPVLWAEQSPASRAAVVAGAKGGASATAGADVLTAGRDGTLRIWGFV